MPWCEDLSVRLENGMGVQNQSKLLLATILSFLSIGTSGWAQDTAVDPLHVQRMKAGMAIFKSGVRATLETSCLECHNAKSRKGDFDLSTRDALLESGFLAHVGRRKSLVAACKA